jgi:transcriptional regulator with XRE-family HTH domain
VKRITLKEARGRARLTQRQLAEKSRVDQRAISKLENGLSREPMFSTGLALADALEIDPHRLRFGVMPEEAGA